MTSGIISFSQAVISGLLMGGTYSAIAVGFSLTWGVTNVINIAHPAFALLGAYIAYWVLHFWGIDPLLSLLIIVPISFFLGIVSHRCLFKPLSTRTRNLTASSMVLTSGLVIVVENIILISCKADPRVITTAYTGKSLFIAGVALPITSLISFVLALITCVVLYVFLHNTYEGKAVRAVWQQKEGAMLCGINTSHVTDITYGISFASAGVGGVCMGMMYSIEPAIHSTWLIYIFLIVIAGGLGSIRGTVFSGLLIGLIIGLAGFVLPYVWVNLILFGLLLIVLLIKPEGLFQQ